MRSTKGSPEAALFRFLSFILTRMLPENFTDLIKCSFDEFVTFLFERPVPSGESSFAEVARSGETDKWNPWYYDSHVSFDPFCLCDHYSRLFS